MSTTYEKEYNTLMKNEFEKISNIIHSLFDKYQTVDINILKEPLTKELAIAFNKTEDQIEKIFINNPEFKENLEGVFGMVHIYKVMSKEIEEETINKYNELISTKSDIINNVFKNNMNIIKSGNVDELATLLSNALNMPKDDIVYIFSSNISYIQNDIRDRFYNKNVKSQEKKNLIYLVIGIIMVVVLLYILFKKTKNKR